jgi:hypothetical protein
MRTESRTAGQEGREFCAPLVHFGAARRKLREDSQTASGVTPRLELAKQLLTAPVCDWRYNTHRFFQRTWRGWLMETNTRREPRHPFVAAGELLDESSGSRMDIQVSDLSFGGCYVDTVNPLPSGTAIQMKIFTTTHSFQAPATVVYSHTHLGMGMKFGLVSPQHEEVLRLWLPEAAGHTQSAHA